MEEEKKEQQIPFDLACHRFDSGIADLINEARLPVSAIYYILKDNLTRIQEIKEQIRLEQEYQLLNAEPKEVTQEVPLVVEGEEESQE